MKTLTNLALITLTATAIAAQNGPTRGNVRVDGTFKLQPNGDGQADVRIGFSPADYTRIKSENPNAFRFLKDYSSGRTDTVITDTTARYEDAKSAVILKMTQRGALQNRGAGRWQLPFNRGIDFVNIAKSDGKIIAYFVESGEWAGGIRFKGQSRYYLPQGAKDAKWNANDRILSYTLDRAETAGAALLTQNLQSKTRLMSALYKVYGLGTDFAAMWVAKSTFRNSGKSTIKNLRVRFRLSGYSEWSLWQSYPEMVPDQTIVANYYPVLDAKIARLTSNTPANLIAEWEYQDADGKTQKSSDGRRLVVLGSQEFLFSDVKGDESFGTWMESHANAPFVAAWVSRDDKVVAEFASMANRRAGGVGASDSDKNSLRVLGEIYRLMQVNNFTYQHPAGLLDRTVAFDAKSVQSLQFPRDTIRKRSGTCIDLAILYAACAESVGVRSFLAMVPGHCFPVFRLPSGQLIGIEATGVGGGLKHGTALFDSMVTEGIKKLAKWNRDGRIQLLDLQKLWTRGISNPELAELPADIVQKWGLVETRKGEEILYQVNQNRRKNVGDLGNNERNNNQPQATFAGTWKGNIRERLDSGQVITYPAAVTFTKQRNGSYSFLAIAQASIPDGWGGFVRIRVRSIGTAVVQNGTLVAKGTKKVATYLDSNVNEPMQPDIGRFTITNGKLTGRTGNQFDGYVSISFVKG